MRTTTNLHQASRQWATRPDDQRFWNLQEMRDACAKYAAESKELSVRLCDVHAEARGDELVLVGKSDRPAYLTNYAFNQFAGFVRAPAGYLSSLPARLASECLNSSLPTAPNLFDERRMLVHQNGNVTARCMVSDKYKRVWNYELVDRLLRLDPLRWKNPPAWGHSPRSRLATEADVIPGVSIVKVGDEIQPSGLYASEKDAFAFLVNTSRTIEGSPKGLGVGFFVWNSEVGDRTLGIMSFCMDYVCGNHIVWGASDVKELRVRHVGDARDRLESGDRSIVQAIQYADGDAANDFEKKIAWARSYEIAGKPEDLVLEVVKRIDVPAKTVERAYDVAVQNEASYGNPRSVWGVVSGMTQLARDLPNADARVDLDTKAGKLLDAF